ncbi:hypothetical protein [Undibacterium sp. CY21W]|uniref:hypothetical protein n=1 Tax=Undibacterium sp. CY21W TaxID=2762293 RepID=UPI00164B6964|nr:hypothetical protein [Undibacterium sp. CY21W]MBC3927784.1 hypothetical protein [Undibacterium sp. CY21W]
MSSKQSASGEVSLRAYARHRGVALSAVQKAITSGRIKKTAGGKINIVAADLAWAANTDLAKRPPDAAAFDLPDLSDPDDDIDDSDAPVTSEYQKHRANREEIRVKKEQLELDMLMGNTIDLADAQRIIFTAMRTIRDAIMNVPARNKDLLAAEKDPARIEALLESELAAALQSIDVKSALKEQPNEEETEDGSH